MTAPSSTIGSRRSCTASASVPTADPAMRTGAAEKARAASAGASTTAAAPSQMGELSNKLIGSQIIFALSNRSAVTGNWNMAKGLFTPFRWALTANGAKS